MTQKKRRSRPQSTTSTQQRARHPCIFSTRIIREQIDPRVDYLWRNRFGVAAPFGNLRRLFRDGHCKEINPYDSQTCPYTENECAMAFYQCVQKTVEAARDARKASGYFFRVAATTGANRADNKPLQRDRPTITPRPGYLRVARPGGSPRHGLRPASGDQDVVSLRRSTARPEHIGDLLRGLDLRPRERPADDG